MARAAELDDKLNQLDEKLKRNFFDIEKRLTTLESRPDRTEDRIKEVEDLQMLSQLEIMKIKEKKAEPVPVAAGEISLDVEKKLIDLLHRIDALESQRMTEKTASYYISKIAKEKKEIENEFDRMRSVKKDFELILKEKDDIARKIADSELNLEKVDAVYSKMKNMEETATAEVQKIYKMMKGLENRIDDGLEKATSIKKSVETRMNLTEEKFRLRSDKLESLRDSMNAKLVIVDDKIRELESFKKMLGDIEAFRATMEDESVQRIAVEKSMQDLHRRMDDIEQSINSMDIGKKLDDEYVTIVSHEKKMQDFGRRFEALDARMNSVNSSVNTIVDSKLKAVDAKLKEMPEMKQVKDIYARLDAVESTMKTETEFLNYTKVISDLKERVISDEKKVQEMAAKIGSVNSKMDDHAKSMESKIKSMPELKQVRDIYSKLDELEARLDAGSDYLDYTKAIDDLRKKLISVEKGLRATESADYGKMHQKLTSLEKVLLEGEKIDHEKMSREIADIESTIKKAETEMFSKIQTDLETLKTIQTDMKAKLEEGVLTKESILADARQKFEAEVEQKISYFNSRMDELGMKMQLEKEQITKALNMDELVKIRNDILTQKRMIHDIERNLEMSAVRFFTENLEEFAKEIDKKLPQVVARDEFAKEMKIVDARLKKIHAPDVSGLESRLVLLERKIDDIHSMARRFAVQQPIVVE